MVAHQPLLIGKSRHPSYPHFNVRTLSGGKEGKGSGMDNGDAEICLALIVQAEETDTFG